MSFFQMAATALQAVGAIAAGEGNAAAMNDQAGMADANAANTRRVSSADEDTIRRQQRQKMGTIRAQAVQSGFNPNSGSLADLQVKSAAEMELDALTHRYKGELSAIGMENEARSLRANATSARRGGYLNAFGALASSAANYYGSKRIGPLAPVEDRIPKPTGRG